MAVDKNKLIAEATRLVQRGSLDKAIAVYRKILAADPKDVRVLLKVGELHQRKGEAAPASEAFAKVAETYADQGFFLKAIAVYKQIVRLDPVDAQVSERLAALYQQLGLLSDAMAQLQRVAVAAEQAGDTARLGDVLRRMVELDPEDVASTVKLGELHARAGQVPLAVECLRRAAGRLEAQGRTDEYVRVAERLASLEPGDVTLVRKLAHLHLARGDTKRALAKLQLSFKAEPGDVETLHLLARAFRDLGQHAKVVSVYRELALVHGEQGRPGEARATWQKVLELVPGDEEALSALAEVPAEDAAPVKAPPPAAAPAGAPRPPPVPERRRDTSPPVQAARDAAASPARPAAAALPDDPVARLLAEADVYAKYGLHDRALQHLGKVLELDAGAPDAHERARELHAAAGRVAEAAEAGVAAVRALRERGDAERAARALERLRELAPDHPALAALAGEGDATGEPSEEISLEAAELLPAETAPALDDGFAFVEILDPEPAPDEGLALEVGDPEPALELEVEVEAALPPEIARPTRETPAPVQSGVPADAPAAPPQLTRATRVTPAPVPQASAALTAPGARGDGPHLPASHPAVGGGRGGSTGGDRPRTAPGAPAPQLERATRVTPASVPQRGAPRATPASRGDGAPVPASPRAEGEGRRGSTGGERASQPPPQLQRPTRTTPVPSAAAGGAAGDGARPTRTTPAPAAAAAEAAEERPRAARTTPVPSAAAGGAAGQRPRPTRATPVPVAPPAAVLVEEDLSDDLEVAQFFLEQGLVEEARDALRALAAAHPGHRGVRARLEALAPSDHAPTHAADLADEPLAPPHPAHHADDALAPPYPTDHGEHVLVPPPPAHHAEHELAQALEEDLAALPPDDAFQYSVEDVFDQFKKGVEQTVRPEDSATHYDLGIAYREMGLLDDAVQEFETALRGADGRRAVDCLSMLGACRMARGEPREAAAVFRRALASPHLTDEAAKALHFDLGDALEAAGDRQLALQCFRTVSELDPGYRRVADRLAALAGPGAGAPGRKRRAGPRTPE